ncbi:methyltransferase domain-containing protein [Streptomyces sp. GC420]|nr:methyltransferase domain-containing protein [Streptomyces sp. GC420]
MSDAFFTLHHGLPRQGPGSDATTRRLLASAGPLPPRPRILDLGCGPGRSALLLAAETGGHVTAVDLHQPFLDELTAEAERRRLSDRVETVHRSMGDLPYQDGSFHLVWAESSAYSIGFDNALRQWRRLIAPGGALCVTECEWSTGTPSPEARAFWDEHYALRTGEQNIAAARDAGYEVVAVHPLPDSDWFDEYYDPLAARVAAADTTDPDMAAAVDATRAEIALRERHGADYRYTGYVLRPARDRDTPTPRPSRTPER